MMAQPETQIILDIFGVKAEALKPGAKYEVVVEELDRERTARRLTLKEISA